MSLYMGGLLIFVLPAALGGFDTSKPGAGTVLAVIIGSTVFGVGLDLSVTARCPRCGGTVSPWISMYPAFYLPFKGRPKRCPHCRVSLDEPIKP